MAESEVQETIVVAQAAIEERDVERALHARGILSVAVREHPAYERHYRDLYDKITHLQRQPRR